MVSGAIADSAPTTKNDSPPASSGRAECRLNDGAGWAIGKLLAGDAPGR